MKQIKVVTVIGANGTMGCNVAGIFASFGAAKVYMVCRDMESANKALSRSISSVKAEAIGKNLIPKTYDALEECITESDLVFESVCEDAEVKRNVYGKIKKYIQSHAVIGTGTSGLSISELSDCWSEEIKKRFMGIHMYNPPYNMTLCELIPSKYTDSALLDSVKSYLTNVLRRKVVVVADAPAFMGNRIGFQFINEALLYAEKYKDNGGIDYIDSILGAFTGRSMAPLVTSDFVGLDVHKAIVDNIYNNTNDYAHDTFIMPQFALKLISESKLGKKSGGGLYKTTVNSDGSKIINVYDIETNTYRPIQKYGFPFARHMISEFKIGNYTKAFNYLTENHSIESRICLEFLLKYIIYSIITTKAIGESIHSADDVMTAGFNWVPPLGVIDAFGGIDNFKKLVECNLPSELLQRINIAEILVDIPKSQYDFRPFFRAK